MEESKIKKVVIEWDDKIISVEGEDAEKWLEGVKHTEAIAFAHNVKFPELKWTTIPLNDDDYWRQHNKARIEVIMDCKNCTLGKDEEEWFFAEIQKIIEQRGCIPERIRVFS